MKIIKWLSVALLLLIAVLLFNTLRVPTFEPRIAQKGGDDTAAPVMTIHADFGNQHAFRCFLSIFRHQELSYTPSGRALPCTRRTKCFARSRGLSPSSRYQTWDQLAAPSSKSLSILRLTSAATGTSSSTEASSFS